MEKSSSSVQDVLETRIPGLVGFIVTVPSSETSEKRLTRSPWVQVNRVKLKTNTTFLSLYKLLQNNFRAKWKYFTAYQNEKETPCETFF